MLTSKLACFATNIDTSRKFKAKDGSISWHHPYSKINIMWYAVCQDINVWVSLFSYKHHLKDLGPHLWILAYPFMYTPAHNCCLIQAKWNHLQSSLSYFAVSCYAHYIDAFAPVINNIKSEIYQTFRKCVIQLICFSTITDVLQHFYSKSLCTLHYGAQ